MHQTSMIIVSVAIIANMRLLILPCDEDIMSKSSYTNSAASAFFLTISLASFSKNYNPIIPMEDGVFVPLIWLTAFSFTYITQYLAATSRAMAVLMNKKNRMELLQMALFQVIGFPLTIYISWMLTLVINNNHYWLCCFHTNYYALKNVVIFLLTIGLYLVSILPTILLKNQLISVGVTLAIARALQHYTQFDDYTAMNLEVSGTLPNDSISYNSTVLENYEVADSNRIHTYSGLAIFGLNTKPTLEEYQVAVYAAQDSVLCAMLVITLGTIYYPLLLKLFQS